MVDDEAACAALKVEAATLGRYLVGEPVSPAAVDLYVRAVRSGLAPLDRDEAAMLARVIRYPCLLGFVDGGTALRRQGAGLRRRLLLMFAILETSPDHCDAFLPRPTSRLRVLLVVGVAARGAWRAGIGAVLTRFLR